MTDWPIFGVTAAAAVVVAWQSFETRKNARAASDAARAANEAVTLARVEEGHTRTLIAETVKARIDQNTPSVTLVPSRPLWPPVRTLATQGQAPDELVPRTHFTMPRDAGVTVLVRQPLRIHNPTDQQIELRRYEPFYSLQTGELFEQRFTIQPHAELPGYYVIEHTLGEWVEIAESEEPHPGPEHRFQLTYLSQPDTGAIDRYYVLTAGVPIERIPDEQGGWRIAELVRPAPYSDDVMASVVVQEREYFRSWRKNEGLTL